MADALPETFDEVETIKQIADAVGMAESALIDYPAEDAPPEHWLAWLALHAREYRDPVCPDAAGDAAWAILRALLAQKRSHA